MVTVTISNTPWNRWRRAKRRLYADHPENLLPSRIGELTAHLGTVMEFTLPLLLLLTSGPVQTLAVAGMVIFHVQIFSTFPLAILAVVCVGFPVLGNFRPDLVSFLPSMRYYAGNWATSQWLFRKGSERKLDESLVKPAPIVTEQLAKFYEPELIEVLVYKGLAFRSMHSHGRALNGLSARAVDDLSA